MRLRICLFASLIAAAGASPAFAASRRSGAVVPRSSLRLEAVETAPLWQQSVKGNIGVRVTNTSGSARRCIVRLRARNDANRAVWTLRTAFDAPPGTAVHHIKVEASLPLGPYEIAAALDRAALPASGKTVAATPFVPEVVSAFAVIDRGAGTFMPLGSSFLTVQLTDGRVREIPAWLRASGLPLAAPSPEGDTRFTDERDRRMERQLRREARIENIFIARDSLRYEGNGDARFIGETAARAAWARGETPTLPLALDWPVDTTLNASRREEFATSAQALRGLVAAHRLGQLPDFAVVQPRPTAVGPARGGSSILARTAVSAAAGATRVLQPFDETTPFDRDAARSLASVAAWNAIADGMRYEGGLFGSSPLLRGVGFVRARDHLALVWLERNGNPAARLVAKLDAEVFDEWGNKLPQRKGVCVVPLGGGPIWIRSRARDWKRAWESASLEGARLLAAQVLPLRRDPRAGVKTLDVRLQNTGIAPLAGVLSVSAPPGWSLADDDAAFRLPAGESKIFRFAVAVARPNAANEYPVAVEAKRGKSGWAWKQITRVATASEAARPPLIDAELSEWKDADWMRVGAAPVAAQVALRWDASRLYIAAVVSEPRVTAEATAEDFWRRDAIQLVFGLRDEASARPRGAPFRDTDYGFILLPWRDGEARLLRGWNPAMPFDGWNGRVRDRVRWGGAVPGAKAALRRDEMRGVTLYEASLPLSEMPRLRPVRRANDDVAVRFSFQVHSGEAPPLSWSRTNNVFAWWGNPVSFLGGIAPAAQVPLGFSLLPPRELRDLPPAAPPRPAPASMPVLPPPTIAPEARRAPETGAPRNRPSASRREVSPREAPLPGDDFKPPVIEPMSPRTLPPAAPPPGTPIPPAPTAKE